MTFDPFSCQGGDKPHKGDRKFARATLAVALANRLLPGEAA
ncbi:MAG TPA: hypothetical protein VNE38_12675 [Ktedonobacteraceae bacterium]|nr:hypothetical protein [Ktedonobacteraceae bacterium]